MHDHFDVLIVGAGLSGIGAAYHLQKKCPHKTYAIVERRQAMGGTWDLFRYPGIRSDSDMHTMGFSFKPWTQPKAIADGPSIREYIHETAAEYGIDQHINYGCKVTAASWSSDNGTWTVSIEKEGEVVTYSCNFLYMCNGYYSYDQAYKPEWKGVDAFKGQLVHPQFWPEDLDYKDKKVVIVGSGATAVTLLPSMAEDAAHITMLQRSPTYMVSRPAEDKLANLLRKLLPEQWAYDLIRARNIGWQQLFFNESRKRPAKVKQKLLEMVEDALDDKTQLKAHFTPTYDPWDQRLCLVPDNDFFDALNRGKATIVTDHIAQFTETGIQLKSGALLAADIIITATGLHMQILDEIAFRVDGEQTSIADTVIYKGAMVSGVPNLALTMGYSNASWTLKADLTASYVTRVLRYMDRKGYSKCVPDMGTASVGIDPIMNLTSGYVQRAKDRMPRQGDKAPWRIRHNYFLDRFILGWSRVDDGALRFSGNMSATAQTAHSS